MIKVTAERGSLDPDHVKKLLGIRGGQLRRLVTIPAADDLEETRLHLARVSQRDIRLGLARLKEAPGVHDVETEKRKAADLD